ncbi:MAG: proline--tRNA ligase [Legionellales bacterium]|jgi:prolyl-tRNA synthetase|nr:proline--tRNA ligase [Legionellales bacterium]
MLASNFFIQTKKETPADAEIISHQLMIRAGLIKKLSSGIYSYLPLGLRILRKVENIIRQELNSTGAMEIMMPSIQPASLWEETNRWESTGAELLKIKDRHKRDFCFGPTHEEVVTDIVRKEVSSYKQLPLVLYQIQTKFRDEIRPRFGVMRSREFIMKDAYSFHKNEESLEETYGSMYEAYTRIFQRLGLRFRAVLADSGNIGGKLSHEFHVLADSGEDTIAYCNNSDYAANLELATTITPVESNAESGPELEEIETPETTTIESLCNHLNVKAEETVKVIIVKGEEHPLVACILRGDHTLNQTKIEKHPLVKTPLALADKNDIAEHLQQEPGYIGPLGLNIPNIVDPFAAALDSFVCGANKNNYHYKNVIWSRDCNIGEILDIREVCPGDTSPDNNGELQFAKGIEVGHIFNLGIKYSKQMNATALDENGKPFPMIMGCYGIGVSRIIAAAIEQNNDENGIIWPEGMAPFQVHIIPMNYHRSENIKSFSDDIYQKLQKLGIETMLDDRNMRAGALFADADLIGTPHQVIIGERNLAEGKVEYKNRRSGEKQLLSVNELLKILELN